MKLRLRRFLGGIRFRLALWFTVVLAVFMLSFSVFVYTSQARSLKNETLDYLHSKTRKLEAYLNYGPQEYFEKRRLLSVVGEQGEGYYLNEHDILALVGLEGQVVQKVGPVTGADLQQLALDGMAADGPRFFSTSVLETSLDREGGRQEYIFVVAPILFKDTPIGSLVLGSPLDPFGQLARLLFTLILGNTATLALALAGGYLLADRAMRPVQTITRTAREIGETDLSRRLNLGRQDELGELADTFDGMLARLQAAFDRQRQFTADASHELRTPLTIVNLETSRALASRRKPDEYIRALTVIQSENEFMTRLVNNLLILSRMDAGQAVLQFEPLDLSDLALEVVERLTPLAERRGVQLDTGQLPELKVSGDRQYLVQMIANLVENAIKYARPDGAWARIETGLVVSGESSAPDFGWLQVEDNGPGIAPEHLTHIFDRFYQVDQARSHHAEAPETPPASDQETAGSGLGLSIVQRIARAHGGEVSVRSQPGQGSLFRVLLPLWRPGSSPASAGREKRAAPPAELPPFPSETPASSDIGI